MTRLPDCGWPIEGDFAALLDGDPVRLRSALVWPLPPLSIGAGPEVVVTDRLGDEPAVIRPPSLVVGIGAVRDTPTGRILAMIDVALSEADLAAGSVRALATAEVKADDTGVATAARERNWPLIAYPAKVLARIPVPNPSAYVAAAVGTPSVAEAAALIGREAQLIVPKRHDGAVTVAVARHAPRGRLTLLDRGWSPAGELRRSSIVVCDGGHPLAAVHPATRVVAGGAPDAVALARQGHAVALVCHGGHAGDRPAAEVAALLSTSDSPADREVDLTDCRPAPR
ncbi:cobalamin biosynthesis protein [Amycolatopsis sp. MtRt-6]|uniref:cobalamin biosynthesis protein n=1 Tax=Amycolatopsis sp. MtRt-6 TaxID=2792782 RepID=UPI001A8C706B|nr:cobalamin biosynthesis protein [Amycolatopsis sp. MtRt-6]